MKIDEDARVAAVDALMARGFAWTHSTDLVRWVLDAYLAALPALTPAEPGRDRIAAVVDEHGYVIASSATYAFKALQERLEADGSKGPFEHFYITGNWPRPKPAEPVEVEGSVEGVG